MISKEANLRQDIYEHGGSRIWIEEDDGTRSLVADTYTTAELSKAIRDFILAWLIEKNRKEKLS